ncbi:MAG: hypothetical protein QM303_06365 [Bacillota bacterium]|nr:hypothetical protein [Bacillota bacterium]
MIKIYGFLNQRWSHIRSKDFVYFIKSYLLQHVFPDAPVGAGPGAVPGPAFIIPVAGAVVGGGIAYISGAAHSTEYQTCEQKHSFGFLPGPFGVLLAFKHSFLHPVE